MNDLLTRSKHEEDLLTKIRNEKKTRRRLFADRIATGAGHSDPFFTTLEQMMLKYSSTKYWTVGELAEFAREFKISVDSPDFQFDRFSDLSKRDQYAVIQAALRKMSDKIDCCLGSDDGREVRAYFLKELDN